MEDYLAERKVMQEALFKEVQPMAGAAHLVQSLVSDLETVELIWRKLIFQHAAGVPIALATGSTYANYLFKTVSSAHCLAELSL